MATSEAKQRIKDQPSMSPSSNKISNSSNSRNKRARKIAMARRGLRSLAVAVGVPLVLTIFTIYCFRLSRGYAELAKSAWYPPIWVVHLASLSSSCLMGLSSWLVWAERGCHQPATTLAMFATQLVLGLLWGPIVFWMGATRLGMVVGLVLLGAIYGCSVGFREVNPIAGDLVKPCIAWAAFLVIMNYKLL